MTKPRPFTEQITFLSVEELPRSAAFYGETLGLSLVVDQGDCRIYRVTDDAYLGVCTRPGRTETEGVIVTLVTDDVDGWHNQLVTAGVECVQPPSSHPKYAIYQAFYHDPDGHLIEIQRFGDPEWCRPI
ncbi:MAG: VOC family protein [bacterium]|nr:VOC family protein [bacterium]